MKVRNKHKKRLRMMIRDKRQVETVRVVNDDERLVLIFSGRFIGDGSTIRGMNATVVNYGGWPE